MGPLTTPKKGREAGSVDPWTPTSNLKMLISAASPDIRNREKELCMDNDGREGVDPTQVQKKKKRSNLALKQDILFDWFKLTNFLFVDFYHLPVGH